MLPSDARSLDLLGSLQLCPLPAPSDEMFSDTVSLVDIGVVPLPHRVPVRLRTSRIPCSNKLQSLNR